MENEQQLRDFNSVIEKHYEEYQSKMRQWAFLNHVDFDEDTINETYVKVCNIILKKGLKATTEQEYLDYYFKAFKFNTYQEHLQKQKKRIDKNVNYEEVELFNEDYSEDKYFFQDCTKLYLEKVIKENFDPLTYSIWRLRYLISVNGETLNYKQIKELTKINDVRSRIVKVNRFLRENITKQDIKEAIKQNKIFN